MWFQQQELCFKALYRAWHQCQRRKAGKAPAQRYAMNLLENLFETLQQLQQGDYQSTVSYSFVTQRPKLREIHAANFRDRVVHHFLVPQLEAIWEPVFIHDVYSNRKNKGTHRAVKRLQQFMRKADTQYFLQLDIKNFFYSIQQETLLKQLQRGLRKKHGYSSTKDNGGTIQAQSVHKAQQRARFLYWLCGVFIRADYQKVHELDKRLALKVPLHKQLKLQPAGQGLPIGNLTSQFFANVYLNELDQFIKHQLKCRYYLRYVDDFILLGNNQQQLQQWQQRIEAFLQQQLNLKLKQTVTPKSIADGADFLGFIVRPHYILVRRRVVNHLTEKLNEFEAVLFGSRSQADVAPAMVAANGSLTLATDVKNVLLQPQVMDKIRATLVSYLGHFKHANSLKLVQSLWVKYHWLNWLFEFDHQRWTIQPKYQPPAAVNYKQQILFFKRNYPAADLRVQKGRQFISYPANGFGADRVIKRVDIIQTGFNALGIQQRRVQQLQLT